MEEEAASESSAAGRGVMDAPPLVPVVCGDTHGVLDVASFTILTRMRDGTEELLNPTAFEREAGRGLCKKWKVGNLVGFAAAADLVAAAWRRC